MKRFTGKAEDKLDTLSIDENRFEGNITPVILQKGDLLYRFCKNSEAKYSDCWTDKDTIKQIFQGYHDQYVQKPFGNQKSIVKAQTYNFLGIAKSWNTLEYLLVVEIKKDIIAYEGMVRQQSFFQSQHIPENSELRKIKMAGGGTQLIIPRIKFYASKRDMVTIHSYMVDVELNRFTESSWYKRLVVAGYHM